MARARKSGKGKIARDTYAARAAVATLDQTLLPPLTDPTGERHWLRAFRQVDPTLLARLLVLPGLLLAIALHVLHVFTGPPSFDEHFHLHFLWLTGQGILPRDQFLCPYPPTAYYLLAPLMRCLPESPVVFLALRWLTLLPAVGFVLALLALANRCARPVALTAAWIFAGLASSQFPSFWEIRFDVVAWALALSALAMLLGEDRPIALAGAAALACLSVLISPKHVLMLGGAAGAYGLHRLLTAPRQFPRALGLAVAGALAPLALLSLLRPAFLDDAWDLALLNIRMQADSTYPVELLEALLNLMIEYPLLTAQIWAGPVLFLLQAPALPRKIRWVFTGLLIGNVATLLTLPCGYTQYVSLLWALFAPFVFWMMPTSAARWSGLVLACALLLHLGWFSARDLALLKQENLLAQQFELQEELARICPPGETDSAAPFGHTWCRPSPGYVFIDNKPSYEKVVLPERRVYFTEEYFYQRLLARPPAFDIPFTTTDSQPEAYQKARTRFLTLRKDEYVFGWLPYAGHAALRDQRLYLFVRRDRVPHARHFHPVAPLP